MYSKKVMCAVHNITFSEQKVTPNIHATGLSPCLNFFKMAVSPGKLDNLGGSCKPKHHLGRPVEDPAGKAQLPHPLNL